MQGKETERSSTRGKGWSSRGGANYKVAAIVFFWVILILSHLSFSSSAKVLDRNGGLYRSSPSPSPSLPRKAHVVETKTTSFHAPLSPNDINNGASGYPDTLYGDDKRLVHTGPNPLHN